MKAANKMKMQLYRMGDNICKSCDNRVNIQNKGLQLNSKKKKNIKKWANTWIDKRPTDGQKYEKMHGYAPNVTNIRELCLKTTVTQDLILLRMAIIKRQEITSWERESLWTTGEKLDWCSHCGKQDRGSSKN